MYQSLNDFFKSWEFEANCTQRLLNNLTDESLKQEITSENWTLGRIAWHTVAAIRIINLNSNLAFEGPTKDYPVPTSAQFIADSYSQVNNAFVQAVKTNWTDQTLHEHINFFGQEMRIGTLLMFLIQHQNHHRGQMTVLMRQAGLTVPGIYGPAKEEWTNFGMEAPEM